MNDVVVVVVVEVDVDVVVVVAVVMVVLNADKNAACAEETRVVARMRNFFIFALEFVEGRMSRN